MMQHDSIELAYRHCWEIAKTHYENFPVASYLLNKSLRHATAAIYTYARIADDIVDEGNADAATRHQQLNQLEQNLLNIASNTEQQDPLFIALADVIRRYQIPLTPFRNLLLAFHQDVDKRRYADRDEVLAYCRHSADPVGRIILYLHRNANETRLQLSDKICTALQLINFIQDIEQDVRLRDRIYLPMDKLQQFAVSEYQIKQNIESENLTLLVLHELDYAAQLLAAGAVLVTQLNGRLHWELKAIVASAWQLAQKLYRRNNVYVRPALTWRDVPAILLNMVFFKRRIICAKLPKIASTAP